MRPLKYPHNDSPPHDQEINSPSLVILCLLLANFTKVTFVIICDNKPALFCVSSENEFPRKAR